MNVRHGVVGALVATACVALVWWCATDTHIAAPEVGVAPVDFEPTVFDPIGDESPSDPVRLHAWAIRLDKGHDCSVERAAADFIDEVIEDDAFDGYACGEVHGTSEHMLTHRQTTHMKLNGPSLEWSNFSFTHRGWNKGSRVLRLGIVHHRNGSDDPALEVTMRVKDRSHWTHVVSGKDWMAVFRVERMIGYDEE